MLIPPYGMGAPFPVPESLIELWPLWYGFISLMGVLLVCNILALNVIECMLTVLMMLLSWVIVRRNFEAAGSMVMSYGVLCLVQFFFEMMPLALALARGRVSAMADHESHASVGDGIEKTTITHSVKTSPFFDASLGLRYNMHSVSMILSPVCMLLGAWLSLYSWR